MSIKDMEAKAQELQELKRMREELDAEIEAAQDVIKAAMGDQEAITAGAFKITWKAVESVRMDAKALQKALPDIAARFMVKTTVRRFCIN